MNGKHKCMRTPKNAKEHLPFEKCYAFGKCVGTQTMFAHSDRRL